MNADGILKTLQQIPRMRYRPPLLAKIARGYFRTLVLKRPTLACCEFSITNACQSNCTFCYASKFPRARERVLGVDEIAETWAQALRMGCYSTLILGGEPLLHPRFFDIIEMMEPRKHIITFVTNSIALTDAKVRELKQLGVFTIGISLNSTDPIRNDRVRGYDGHHAAAMRAIASCKQHGIDAHICVATAKPLLDETTALVEFARQNDLGVAINLLCPSGRAEGQPDLLFDAEFWTTLRELNNKNPRMRSDYDVNLDLRVGCPGGFEKVHVGPYGDVTGCSMMPTSFGNVREAPLADIVAKMRRFRHFSKRSPQCLVAVDDEYIRDYMDFAQQCDSTPYRVEKNPCYQRDGDCACGPLN